MSKSICKTCIHNSTIRGKMCDVKNGIWCTAEYGRKITKNMKGCKNYKERSNV